MHLLKHHPIVGLIIASLLAVGSVLLFWAISTGHSHHGTSQVPALDIVSGDLTETDRDSIPSTIANMSGKHLSGRDLVVRRNSYHKDFDSAGVTSQISFIVDVDSIKASYQVLVTYANGSALGAQVSCADAQAPRYTCNAAVPAMEY